ncbi:hypothetical protein CFT13S00388_02680 [Campylobacter fetus subsp. testudinum]|uniref:hypothetical protein n=1 Tax=Campylobacter fetus TaxID=196 RepID=UPI000818A965|nr:hypothetical protein [Campylobacter fetus]OCR88089.1 hypothetical protein CFT13S00388_02680 [Campylobacter fetus subsp. testudinum]
MIDLIKKELDKRHFFNTPIPKFLSELIDTIPNNGIDNKMKLTIAISEIILFASQFRRNILHWNGSLIPINAITFCISASGTGKDSSVNAIRRNFSLGYEIINNRRRYLAISRAKKSAKSKKQAHSDDEEVYMKFYEAPMPLFTSPSTNEGYIQYLNTLDNDGIGAGYIYSGEIGAELLTSSVIISNLQLLAELYDEGKKEVKVLKDKEKQSQEIKNLPVSSLFMGSSENILFDDSVKRKFKTEFTTKLARRSFFNFNFNVPEQKEYKSVDEYLKEETYLEDKAKNLSDKFKTEFKELALTQIPSIGKPITVSKEVRDLVTLYKKYNSELSDSIKRQYPITKLVRAHMHWKALKLSGALAFIKGNEEISSEDYKQAVFFTEMLAEDMLSFETELIKEPYELFVSLVHQILENNRCFVDIHNLKKLGYIQGSNNITNKIKELVTLASSFDTSGIYKPLDNGIEFTLIIKTNVLGVSFIPVTGSKDDRKVQCSSKFQYAETNFKALGDMLKGDYAYSPFKFKDGIRSKENVISNCKWIALDIDDSLFTDIQMHEILSNFNHHIVRTSDKSNAHKFRVLLELDAYVDLDDRAYKSFIRSIAKYLSLNADILPKSQIYFSYSDREILSVTNKEPIETREHLLEAYSASNTSSNPLNDISKLSDMQKKTLLQDPLDTFRYAFEAKAGEGSVSLIRAAKHARDLGMSKDEILNLMEEINDYWSYPMERVRFENTILNQIRNW